MTYSPNHRYLRRGGGSRNTTRSSYSSRSSRIYSSRPTTYTSNYRKPVINKTYRPSSRSTYYSGSRFVKYKPETRMSVYAPFVSMPAPYWDNYLNKRRWGMGCESGRHYRSHCCSNEKLSYYNFSTYENMAEFNYKSPFCLNYSEACGFSPNTVSVEYSYSAGAVVSLAIVIGFIYGVVKWIK